LFLFLLGLARFFKLLLLLGPLLLAFFLFFLERVEIDKEENRIGGEAIVSNAEVWIFRQRFTARGPEIVCL
jgi:hypothetical protein